jgi:hypothetical protein
MDHNYQEFGIFTHHLLVLSLREQLGSSYVARILKIGS